MSELDCRVCGFHAADVEELCAHEHITHAGEAVNDWEMPPWLTAELRYRKREKHNMTVYIVKDSAGAVHSVSADRFSTESFAGETIIVYHFVRGGDRVGSFINPIAVTTQSLSDVLSVRTRVHFTVGGHPGDVTRLLKQWARDHAYTIEDLTTARV